MPLIWDETLYNNTYSRGYNRAGYFRPGGVGLEHHKRLLHRLERTLPKFNRNSDVLVVGCAYGYLMEVMIDLGARNVWGTDTSEYIHAHKHSEARADITQRILSIDIVHDQARDAFRAAGAGGTGQNEGRFHWVVTEHVIEGFHPATELVELDAFLDGCENLLRVTGQQKGIVHLFAGLKPDYPTGSPHDHSLGITWQTGDDWSALRPDHYWIDAHTWKVYGGE